MTDKLRLRNFNDNDIILFQNWLNEEHIIKWFQEPGAWIKEIQNRQGEFNWIHHFIAVLGKKEIGFGQFYQYKNGQEQWHGDIGLEGTYSIDYFIGDKAYLNKGLGREIIKLLTKNVLAIPGAKRIIARPDPGNVSSCNALLSAGFRHDLKNKLYSIEKERGGL